MHVSPLMSSGRIPIFTLPLVVFESAVALLDEGAAPPDILGTVPVGALALTLETAPAWQESRRHASTRIGVVHRKLFIWHNRQ